MSNKQPLISAIIVAYQSDRLIGMCIKSLSKSANHAKIPIEIIVVLNDHNNNKYIFPKNIRLIKAKYNLGYAKGLNEGAKIAKGQWLLILNPDTITTKDALKHLSTHFQSPSMAIVAPLIQNPNKTTQLTLNGEPTLLNEFLERSYLYKIFPFIFRNQKSNKNLYRYSHFVNAVEGTYFAVRHTVFKEIGGFDERFFMYFEDMDLCKRVINKSYKIIFEPRGKIIHLGQKSSNGRMLGDLYLDSLYKYLAKHYSRFYACLGVIIVVVGAIIRVIYWKLRKKFTSRKKVIVFGNSKIIYCNEIIQEFISSEFINLHKKYTT